MDTIEIINDETGLQQLRQYNLDKVSHTFDKFMTNLITVSLVKLDRRGI